jgi:DtxR family Mn-dependent transcriptional regulator
MQLSFTEENYLKAIYQLWEKNVKKVTTNSIASAVQSAPASVTDMIRKLHEKKLINYARYKGVSLTRTGKKMAVGIIRKHRLWELFLYSKLGFSWDEVHDIAEQLEHIRSEALVEKLYEYLGKPKWDPHGDPIPDGNGIFHERRTIHLSRAKTNGIYRVSGVADHSPHFLQYLDKNGFTLSKKIIVKSITSYDGSMTLTLGNSRALKHISSEVAENLLVTPYRKEK